MLKNLYHWGPAAACAALIFALSHQSDPPGAEWFSSFDSVVHFLEYGMFALTLVWGATSGFRLSLTTKSAVVVCAVALLYALSDEWHQSLIPNRDASLLDVVADAVGSIASVMIVYRSGQGTSR
ncbi:MAG: VanZ family protein [Acidobacteria bacterium]|nr:VanZ family protein [Acidobacteriota bacterium]